MNAVKRTHLKRLISAAYGLAGSLLGKEEVELTAQESNLVNVINDCSEFGISGKSVDDIGRTVSVFASHGFIGTYEYDEIFEQRDLITTGTVIRLNDQDYVVLYVMLKSDKSINIDVHEFVEVKRDLH